MRLALVFALAVVVSPAAGQRDSIPEYQSLRDSLIEKFRSLVPGEFTSSGKGVATKIRTNKKIVALTLDACGGPTGSGYDTALIKFLHDERIPATIFLAGPWIDAHPDIVRELAKDTLFEIENHGLLHRPCSISGKSKYKVKGTADSGEAIDEIELNARKIERLTGRRPLFYRSSTAFAEVGCPAIARSLGQTIVTYSVLSGDAVIGATAEAIDGSIVTGTARGSIIILHMNHPERNTFEALQKSIPTLRHKGYSFVQLQTQYLLGSR